ncbi:hypothetical protein HC028_14065 [Planosporangium flavigriseum]|uniref:DUF7144 domain-containing protein n=1 Tax=Planosporangium flavigriseum TaxID=373681 RepID=A0A8J3PLR7_9ACTN|nr:hypothetical protein [Planosporangium flavigriseum]NJC65615.1 hypothetical protein [Planosporangium flavigriseum]GIG74776.1 hypothetical protein Pfl04_31800 [Planosporangium flavigriseum]
MTQSTSPRSGWISFATVILTIIGAFNIAHGLATLMVGTVSFVDAGRLIVVNLTAWGVLALVSGALLIAVGLGLLARSQLARVAAVVLICLHALIQVAVLAAFPIWSLIMVALDVVVLFALTVHWPDAVVEPVTEPLAVPDARPAGGAPR